MGIPGVAGSRALIACAEPVVCWNLPIRSASLGPCTARRGQHADAPKLEGRVVTAPLLCITSAACQPIELAAASPARHSLLGHTRKTSRAPAQWQALLVCCLLACGITTDCPRSGCVQSNANGSSAAKEELASWLCMQRVRARPQALRRPEALRALRPDGKDLRRWQGGAAANGQGHKRPGRRTARPRPKARGFPDGHRRRARSSQSSSAPSLPVAP